MSEATSEVPVGGSLRLGPIGSPPEPAASATLPGLHWTCLTLDRSTIVSFTGDVDRASCHLVAAALQTTPQQTTPPLGGLGPGL